MRLALPETKIYHDPVMVGEVIEGLRVRQGGIYVDCTMGEGGHAEAILEAGGQVIGLDADPEILKTARRRLERYREALSPVNASYEDLLRVAHRHSAMRVDGVLMDLGVSSFQLEAGGRGFSFQRDEPLDMRFAPFEGPTASQVVNEYPEERLANVIYRYGQERRSRRIARELVKSRPMGSSLELADVVRRAVGGRRGKTHPATRTFQAIRIEVNEELKSLHTGLTQTVQIAAPEGRIVVISYHSLEDGIVKEFFKREAVDCICPPGALACRCGHKATVKIINKRVIKPQPVEVMVNPRSRSARLRVAERA